MQVAVNRVASVHPVVIDRVTLVEAGRPNVVQYEARCGACAGGTLAGGGQLVAVAAEAAAILRLGREHVDTRHPDVDDAA